MNKRKITYSLTIIIGTLLILSAAGTLIRQAVLNEQKNKATAEIVSKMEKILPDRTAGSPEPHYGYAHFMRSKKKCSMPTPIEWTTVLSACLNRGYVPSNGENRMQKPSLAQRLK